MTEPVGMRMAELAAKSGVARETIHFYLREGLLPRPRKGGRTVAYYDAEHLERLRLIRRLREEKYFPLAVIRKVLETPGATAEGDLDGLAEVMHIVPGGKGGGGCGGGGRGGGGGGGGGCRARGGGCARAARQSTRRPAPNRSAGCVRAACPRRRGRGAHARSTGARSDARRSRSVRGGPGRI